MPRGLAVLLVIVLVIVGGTFLLSNRVEEQPLTTIEADVTANAG